MYRTIGFMLNVNCIDHPNWKPFHSLIFRLPSMVSWHIFVLMMFICGHRTGVVLNVLKLIHDATIRSMYVGTMWHCALVSCTPSQCLGLIFGWVLFWCLVSLCVPFINSLIECYFIMMVATIIGTFMAILSILIYTVGLFVTRQFWFCRYAPSWMFPSLDILFEYWIEHVTFGLLYVMLGFPTRIFYKGVLGFTKDCRCLVPWINQLPLVCWSTFWKSSLNW